MISIMKPASYDKNLTIRTTAQSQRALDRIVADLRASGRLKFRGKLVTKEALVNATWLWLEGAGVEAVEEALAPYLARFEGFFADNQSESLGAEKDRGTEKILPGIGEAADDDEGLAKKVRKGKKKGPKKASGVMAEDKGPTEAQKKRG